MPPRHTSTAALPWKSPVTSAPTTHTAHFPSFELVLKLFQKIIHSASVTFSKRPGLPNVPACDRQHRTGSQSCGAGRFAALSGEGIIKFWQDDAEDGYPAWTPRLWCCQLPRHPAQRWLRARRSQGKDELSHAESAGADSGRYGVGRDGSCSQERLLCPRGWAEPDTGKAARGHCQAPQPNPLKEPPCLREQRRHMPPCVPKGTGPRQKANGDKRDG